MLQSILTKEAFSYLLTTYPLALSTAKGTLYKPRTKHLFRNYLINSSAAFVEILSELNPVVIYDVMAVIRSVPSQPTWEDLFKILIKVYKLKESTETILVFDNCTDELEYSLKEQERLDRAGSPGPFRTHISEISQENKSHTPMSSYTENKSQLQKKFTEYLTHESTRKGLIGCTTLNIEKDTVLISQSQQQSLFTSNQKEPDTRIALHCSESSQPVWVKVKDTDILILMVYDFALISPPYDWYLQIDNGKIVSVKKIIKILEKQLVCAYLSFILLLAATRSATSLEHQKHVFSKDC